MYNITGKKFNRLLVIKMTKVDKQYTPYWLCRCDCGKEKEVRGDLLKNGKTKSCGCLHSEQSRIRQRAMCLKHGKAGTKIYRAWKGILVRCNKKNTTSYKNYGGRGIICEWQSFDDFFRDMGDVPEGYTIDRIDNNGNYSKENCRWATKTEQANNRRTAHLVIYEGKTKNLKTWAKELNIPNKTLHWRLKHGWSVEKALGFVV